MASPQKENGYTPIAHEILLALAYTNLSNYEARIVYVLLRKTYGFNKSKDFLSVSQLVHYTGIKKSNVSRTKSRLMKRKIVIQIDNQIAFQKDYEQWLSKNLKHKELSKQITGVIQIDNKSYPNRGTQKIYINNTTRAFARDKKKMDTKHSDYNEEQIDAETNLTLSPVQPAGNIGRVMKELIEWARKEKGRRFTNIPKQYKALKLMRIAGISPKEIKAEWEEMEDDDFWSEKGFDFMDIANKFNKKNGLR